MTKEEHFILDVTDLFSIPDTVDSSSYYTYEWTCVSTILKSDGFTKGTGTGFFIPQRKYLWGLGLH